MKLFFCLAILLLLFGCAQKSSYEACMDICRFELRDETNLCTNDDVENSTINTALAITGQELIEIDCGITYPSFETCHEKCDGVKE